MQVELIESPSYAIKVGEVEVHGFKQVSQWNGLRELKNHEGHVAIVIDGDGGEFATLFANIFKHPRSGTMVAASNSLIKLLNPGGGSKV